MMKSTTVSHKYLTHLLTGNVGSANQNPLNNNIRDISGHRSYKYSEHTGLAAPVLVALVIFSPNDATDL